MNDVLKSLMNEIDTLSTEERSLTKKASALRAEINLKQDHVSEAVKSGARTGDRLADLVLASCGYQPKILDRYREAELAFAPFVGQCVMVEYEDSIHPVSRFWGKAASREAALVVRVGMLASNELIELPSGVIGVPVECYVQTAKFFHMGYPPKPTWHLVEKNLFERQPGENNPYQFGYQMHSGKSVRTFMIMGNQYVAARLAYHQLGGLIDAVGPLTRSASASAA